MHHISGSISTRCAVKAALMRRQCRNALSISVEMKCDAAHNEVQSRAALVQLNEVKCDECVCMNSVRRHTKNTNFRETRTMWRILYVSSARRRGIFAGATRQGTSAVCVCVKYFPRHRPFQSVRSHARTCYVWLSLALPSKFREWHTIHLALFSHHLLIILPPGSKFQCVGVGFIHRNSQHKIIWNASCNCARRMYMARVMQKPNIFSGRITGHRIHHKEELFVVHSKFCETQIKFAHFSQET